ncbi:S-layer homology domain-containing protein [Paenibacillus sp. 1001270B_150601_E10]|uniref:S-layer homology domain-containing protein n=1 Tax=Paenibacillus sp. 1001270B_150601_E10 TaxID=2787079 RepID=UPI001E5D74C2|nr:S-layer homology domain-containing protein [Paenibacillus sp. 1001270B_150601_E10]
MKKAMLTTIAVTTLLTGGITANAFTAADPIQSGKVSVSQAVTAFKDINGHWAKDVITKASALKLIAGYEDGTFRPNAKVTRAEYATILSRATKLDQNEGKSVFPDLKGHWSETAVSQLVAQGLIQPSDYPNGFKPNQELTRYEMMKWIANGLVKSHASFKEAFDDTKDTLLPTPEAIRGEISSDKVPYLALVRGAGIVEGFSDGSLKPSSTTTRAEVAAILLRYMDVEGKDASSYKALNELREVGTTGTNILSISNYKYHEQSVKLSDLIETKLTLSNKSGVMKLHRLIIVNTTTGKAQGVYSSIFVGERIKKGNYMAFADISFTSNIDKSDLIKFNQGLSNSLIQFNRIDLELANKNGLTTIPNNSAELIKKGIEKRFWMYSALREIDWGYTLQFDNGKKFSINNYIN